MTDKKSVAKKTATKKSPAKKTSAKKTTSKKALTQSKDSKTVTLIAKEILNGSHRWGTGRDRVALLKKAGHDSDAVLKEYSRLRAEARLAAQD